MPVIKSRLRWGFVVVETGFLLYPWLARPGTNFVAQAGLELGDFSASAS